MKRTRFFSATLWIVLVSVLMMALAGCGKKEDTSALASENSELKDQVEELTERLDELESAGLKEWSLKAVAWTDAGGASVTFTGEPNSHEDGQTAQFIVRLNGEEITVLPCFWDGTVYTATAELEAADGYSYTCVLTGSNGEEQITLSSPDVPTYDALVYMASSLNAYCNVFVADWELKDNKLNITSGYVQVQLPQITSDGNTVDFESAQLVFQLNGNDIETQDLKLPAGEGTGSYETALTSVSFDMPEMEADYQLDMILNVKLSDGTTISTFGGSWYYDGDQLNMVVG